MWWFSVDTVYIILCALGGEGRAGEGGVICSRLAFFSSVRKKVPVPSFDVRGFLVFLAVRVVCFLPLPVLL